MAFTPKSWVNGSATNGKLDAAAMIDLETRLSNYSDSVAVAPKNPFRPAGSLYETIPRQSGVIVSIANTLIVNQRLNLFAINIATIETITSISFMTSGATALAGGAHQIFGLYDDSAGTSSGTAYALLRGTSDATNAAWGQSTVKTLNLTSTYTTTRTGAFYIGILLDATTLPTLQGVSASPAALTVLSPSISNHTTATNLTARPNPAGALAAGGDSLLLWGYIS